MDLRRPRRAALFHRLEGPTPDSRQLTFSQPGRHRSRAFGGDQEDVGHAELGGLFDQPGETIAVPGRDCETEGCWPGRHLCLLDDDSYRSSLIPQRACSHQAPPIPEPNADRFAGPAYPEMMSLSWIERDYVADGNPSRRKKNRDHPRRAATAHHPASTASSMTASPAPSSTGRKISASGDSIPAKMAVPAGVRAAVITGSSLTFTLRRMLESTISHGPSSGARWAASPSRNSTLSATPLRSAFCAAIRLASTSISTPVARAAPRVAAATARMPLPLPRSSTRSPART